MRKSTFLLVLQNVAKQVARNLLLPKFSFYQSLCYFFLQFTKSPLEKLKLLQYVMMHYR